LMKNVPFVISFFFLVLFATNSHANVDVTLPTSPVVQSNSQSTNVFVHISAVKKTANGLTAQIDGFSVPRGNGGKNTLRASLEVKGNRLLITLHPKSPKVAQLTMPAGYRLPKAITDKLGANSVVMSGGSTMVKQQSKNMLWFEIQ
ncbi:MAG: hypothetical protein AAFO07_06265, partial [Bacteroidota bacterium]